MSDTGAAHITLDDQTALGAAQADPVGCIRGLDRAIIDEIQRAPELLLAIKKSIDEDYRPGRFLLTGSANVLSLPQFADCLPGRIETFKLNKGAIGKESIANASISLSGCFFLNSTPK